MRRVALLIGFLLCVSAAAAFADVPAVPIPNYPGLVPVAGYEGAPVRARPWPSFRVPEHPFMAPNGRSNIHNDAYMTDAYTQAGPLGRNTTAESTWLGIEECASITFDSHDRIVGLCGTADGARLRMLDPTTMATIALMPLPPRSYRPGTTPLTDFCAAGYFYLDRQDRGVLVTNLNQIWVVGLRDPGAFVLEDSYDLNSVAPPPDCFVSVLPDWDGRIWFVSKASVIGNVNPKTGGVQSVKLPGETVVNSFAVDDGDGVYVVTDHALYRFHADPKTDAPIQDWRAVYDRGTRHKPGMLSQGSGTTPTLMGTRYVSIADNADPYMHVEVYRRDTGKRVCRASVFAKNFGATENSLIAAGNSMIVENNFGYDGPTSVDQGGTSQPGMARVDFDPKRGTCRVVWTSHEISPSTVAKASLGAGLVYAYTKPASDSGEDAWYFTAIDIRTGRTVWKVLTGTGYLYNNHYAPVSIGPDGAAYVGVLGGLLRIADAA